MFVYKAVLCCAFVGLIVGLSIQTYQIKELKSELREMGKHYRGCERERLNWISKWNKVVQKFDDCNVKVLHMTGSVKRTNSKPRQRYNQAYFASFGEDDEEGDVGFFRKVLRWFF